MRDYCLLSCCGRRASIPTARNKLYGQTSREVTGLNVDLIFKIAAIGILVAVLNLLLTRSGRDDQALLTSIAGLVTVLFVVVRKISELFDLIRDLFGF